MLEVKDVNQFYGGSHILRDVSFQAPVGECSVVLGRNGVGKTTLLKCLMGILPIKSGQILLDGQDISKMSPEQRVRAGLAYVPQGRDIFSTLTVEENILIGMAKFKGAKTRNNSSTESINHSLRLRLTHAHMCSIGFKSGLYAGSQRILCPCCSNNS